MREETQFFRRLFVLLQLPGSQRSRRSVEQLRRGLAQQGIETTTRTIERDLLWLARFFPLRCDDSRPRGWFWAEGRESIQIPRLDSPTALVLLLAHESLRPIFPPALLENWEHYRQQAERALMDSSLRDWRRHVAVLTSSVQAPPRLPDWTLTQVLEALESGRQIAFTYQTPWREEAKDHRVSPWGVVLQEGILYLVAYHLGRGAPLLYASQRMQRVRLVQEPAEGMPPGFSLRDFAQANLRFAEPGASIVLRFRVRRDMARLVEERPIGSHQTVESRGRVWVTFRAEVENSAALRWWILSLGAELQVLSPPELVETLRETTMEMARLYTRRPRTASSAKPKTPQKGSA